MSEVGRGLVVSRDITPQLVRVLKINESAEVTETCLELVTNLAETGNFFVFLSLINPPKINAAVFQEQKRHFSNLGNLWLIVKYKFRYSLSIFIYTHKKKVYKDYLSY